MKNILIVCALSLMLSACKDNSEQEYVSFILAVEQESYGTNNLEIEAVVIAPRVTIDSFFVTLTLMNAPFTSTVYRFPGTNHPGRHHFSLNNLNQGTFYKYYISATSFDGRYPRYSQTPETSFQTITGP